MKPVLKALVALVVLVVAYQIGTHMVKPSDEAASAVIPVESPWNYEEEIDPITKKTKSRAAAQLKIQSSIGEAVIADVGWDCADGTFDSLRLEITTFLDEQESDGKLKPYPQDEDHAIDYRFDGVPSSISTKAFLTGASIRREYKNSVQLFLIAKTGLYGRHRYPGLYVAAGKDLDGDESYDTKAFYLVDPEFVVRVPITGGANVVIQFSLEEPAIKKMLTQCGLTYGPVPAKSREASAFKKDDSTASKKPANAPRQIAATNVRIDPNYPLKIGHDYYPLASLKAGEEGRCIVKVTVAADGLVTDESIETSTGFPRLDAACMNAFRGQHLIPATENGKPIERSVSVPIVWTMHTRQ